MKKFFSLVLALVMALSLTTVAWGAGNTYYVKSTGSDAAGTTGAEADPFATLVKAVEVAGDGDKIVLLDAVSGDGVKIDEDLTIDFGGFAYTFSGTGVGSGSLTSNGFQILKDNTVKLMNGTLKVAESAKANYYILVQNYADLTVTNMVLDGTNLDKWSGTDSDSYVLSVNNGTTVINGGTTIIANDDGDLAYAFDTYDKAEYAGVPTVTVDDAVIEGNVEASGGKLNVEDGTFNGEIKVSGTGAAADVTITGGTFSSDVSDYVADGYRLVNGTVASVPANTNGVVGGYEGQLTVKGAPRQAITNFTKTAAVTPDDVNEDGLYNMPGDVIGSIEYYTFNLGGGVAQNYYEVDSVNDADLIVYVGDSLVPYMYLANEPAGGFQYWYGVASFNDFGSACGQFKYADYDATESYYVYAGQVFVLDDDGAVNLKVGTKFVQANNITASGKWVAHTPVYAQNDKGVVTGISCAKCSDVGVIVSNFAALPTAMKAPGMNFPVPGSTSKYYYWVDTAVVAPSTPSTDKVQSAETFDAGIAMYVGMSVMAAAGSAVVLKKKD